MCRENRRGLCEREERRDRERGQSKYEQGTMTYLCEIVIIKLMMLYAS